jgi:cell division protein ZipA
MDADLIRLILLLTGAALVVGIWVWDRWQRSRGEPPTADEDGRFEDDADPHWEDIEPRNEPDSELGEEVARAATEPLLQTRQPDRFDASPEPAMGGRAEADADVEPALGELPMAEPDAASRTPPRLTELPVVDETRDRELPKIGLGAQPREAPSALSVPPAPESELPELRHKPAWLGGDEPLVPAFVLARDDAEAANDLMMESSAAKISAPSREKAAAPKLATNAAPTAGDHDAPTLLMDDDAEPDIPVLELESESIHAPSRPARSKMREVPAKPRPEVEPVSIRNDEDQIDLDLGFTAVDDQDLQDAAADLPELIVQINVVAKKGQPFSGEQVLAAMEQVELRAGEHDIFHRLDSRTRGGGKPKALFSVASMVEPGSFPLKKMKDFSTPGLILFAQLPGPRDGLLVYSDMLYVAERLARLLDARLKDEQRSTLTKQTIEHTRERIAEHKRQITLRLRQARDRQRGRR